MREALKQFLHPGKCVPDIVTFCDPNDLKPNSIFLREKDRIMI